MNRNREDERLTQLLQRAADEYFTGIGERLLTRAQILNAIDSKGGIVMKKKISVFAVAVAMALMLGCAALAAGLGVFGSFVGREDHELSDVRLQKLDAFAVNLEKTQTFTLPGKKKDDADLTDIDKALGRFAGRECTFTLHQGYCDGYRLYYSYTLKLDRPLETVFGEGEPTGGVEWGIEFPGEFAKDRLPADGPDGEIAKWLTDHDAAFAAQDHLSAGDGAWLLDDPLNIFDSDQQWLDDTTLQGYQEVRLPEDYKAGATIDVALPIVYSTQITYQDAEGMKEAFVHEPETRGTVFVPMTIPVTGKTASLSGKLEREDHTASAEITVSEVDVFGRVTTTGASGWVKNGAASGDALSETTDDFIRDYQLVAGDEVLPNIEGGLSDIVDGTYTIGLRFDLPKNTASLALRPVGAQDATNDIPLK